MRIFIAVVVALLASIAPPSSALEPQTLVSEISAAAAAMSDYQTRVVSWATLDGVEERRIVGNPPRPMVFVDGDVTEKAFRDQVTFGRIILRKGLGPNLEMHVHR